MEKISTSGIMKIITKVSNISPWILLAIILLIIVMIFVIAMYSLYKNKNIEIGLSKYFTFKTKD